MALGEKVLCKKARKLEVKRLQKNNVIPERISALDDLLHDVYVICRPKQCDYHHRRDLIQVFNEIAKEIYGNSNDYPVVEGFGSFLMDIFSSKSDLDLSVNFSNNAVEFPREMKIKTLRKFAKKFYALKSKGHVSSVHPIMSAKVPILKVTDYGTGIECDISVENRDGIFKSQIVHMISSVDERFQKLSFLMKAWAKAHNINSSKDHSLNSLSIILLVAFHLQTRDPPILPPFSAIFKDGTDPAAVLKLVNNFLNYGESNKESLAELFITLLIKLSSVEKLWPKGLCASTYQGSWISKKWNSKVGCISVEDFTDRSQNVAKAVGTTQIKKINNCIQLSIQYVFAFMDGHVQGPKLRQFLFGRDAIAIPTLVDRGGTTNSDRMADAWHQIPLDPMQQAKRMRFTQGWEGTQEIKSNEPTILTKRVRATEVWGATQQVTTTLDNPMLTKRMRSTEGWGGTLAEGWGGTQKVMPFDYISANKMRYTDDWGGNPTAGWGCGGMQQQHITLDPPIKTRKMQPAFGWGVWSK